MQLHKGGKLKNLFLCHQELYDPVSKILYSRGLGASVGAEYVEVTDFDKHLPFMKGFHQRYMASGRSMKAWATRTRTCASTPALPKRCSLDHQRHFLGVFGLPVPKPWP